MTSRTPEAAEAARVTGNEAWAIVSRTIAGMLVYGAIGYGLGNWLGSPTAGLSIGVLLGVALGLYLSFVSIKSLGGSNQALKVSTSDSWSAKMTRARMERASEGRTS
jgi:F0F1-type ATP synthase assembly protein I